MPGIAESVRDLGTAPAPALADKAPVAYRAARTAHWDCVAQWMEKRKGLGTVYHRRLSAVFRFLCPPGKRVLELGCAYGDLLASLRPSYGVGIDFSSEMIRHARERHSDLTFLKADAHELELDEKFDVIILSDLVNDLWDVQQVLRQVRKLCAPHTRVIINSYSKLWGLPISIARSLKLAKPNLAQNWLTVEDLTGLLSLTDFEVIRHREEVLLPLPLPLINSFANRFLVKLWPFRIGALTHVLVARPVLTAEERSEVRPLVSVVIAARNEAGNIESIFARTPELGNGTELIFVEGGSSDDTYQVIENTIAAHPERNTKLFKQSGKGKGDAVRLGFARASGDILAILDADLTVPPEDLPRFVEVLTSEKGDFANGCRLVYPMEKEAMRFFNVVGNKFFGLAFSWLLGQPIKDTLCGTKVIRKSDYETLSANRSYFGEFDPFGDFDLLFGAAKLNLKIVDVPIRYRDRTYGETNIQRWSHGWLLLRMVMFAARRIKFV
jgi:SAM-dependent methyltransferase